MREKIPKKSLMTNYVHQIVRIIESSPEIQKDEEKGLKVVGAIYRIEDGTVEFDV